MQKQKAGLVVVGTTIDFSLEANLSEERMFL